MTTNLTLVFVVAQIHSTFLYAYKHWIFAVEKGYFLSRIMLDPQSSIASIL